MADDLGAKLNTDKLLWREDGIMPGDGPSIHVTQSGGIGINVGGFVFVKTLRKWHALAVADEANANVVMLRPNEHALHSIPESK